MCEPQKVVIFSHLVFMVNRLTKTKSREKRDLTALDFKKQCNLFDQIFGQVIWMDSLGRVLGVISYGCMVGLSSLISIHQTKGDNCT